MNSFLKRCRGYFEKFSGYDIDSVGQKSFVITDQRYRNSAWASHRCQLRSIMDSFDIDLVIDVGANEGQFAKELRNFYPGEIHSFEPVSSAYEVLSNEAARDLKWHTHQLALGSHDSEQAMNVSSLSTFSSLLEGNEYGRVRFGRMAENIGKERVSIRRLDAVLDALALGSKSRRIFLKMDTQGFDLKVFDGMGEKINYVYALQSEVSVIPIYDGMPHWTESILAFEKAGFAVSGMFPVNRDSFAVVEFDCLFVRTQT